MPVEYAGFMLKPTGFFSANAAGDIPPERNSRSVLAGEQKGGGGSCCKS
jgi:primary-amine oxidase